MNKLVIGSAIFRGALLLLGASTLSVAQTPVSGRYDHHLSLAVESEGVLSGWLDRSAEQPQCRLYLHVEAAGPRWRLLAFAPDSGDVLQGALLVESNALRLSLARAPKGCEALRQYFVSAPLLRLSQPRNWQSIRLLAAKSSPIRLEPKAAAAVSGQLLHNQAWAISATRAGYSSGVALRESGDAGWLRSADLAPELTNESMRQRWQRPLPGLSAPSTSDERRQWLAMFDWSTECEARFSEQQAAAGHLDGGLSLIQGASQFALLRIGCGRLAFQDSFIYAWIRLGAPEQSRLLLLPGFSAERGEARVSSEHSLLFGQDHVDVAGRTLTVFSKWRNTGECGQLLIFDLNIDGAKLKEWRERSCDAVAPNSTDGDGSGVTNNDDSQSPLQWPLKEGSQLQSN